MKKRTIGLSALIVAGAVTAVGGTALAVTMTAPDAETPALATVPVLAESKPTSSATPAPGAADADQRMEEAIAAALEAAGPGEVIDADVDDDASHAYEIDVRLDSGGVVEVKLDSSLGVVSVEKDDLGGDSADDSMDDSVDDDAPVSASDAKAASKAALAHVGSGTVTEVDASDDADHAWEVEIDLGDGKDADVELDADFTVVKVD